MLDKMTQQQRMLLALVLSFLFFIVYESLMPKPKRVDLNSSKSSALKDESLSKAAPKVSLNQSPKEEAAPESIKSSSKVISTIRSNRFEATIDEFGRVSDFKVLLKKFIEKDGEYPDVISNKNEVLPFEIRFSDPKLNQEAFTIPYIASESEVDLESGKRVLTLKQELSSLTVTKKIAFDKDGNFELFVSLSKDMPYFITNGSRPVIDTDRYTFNGVLIRKSDGKLETIEDGDAKEDLSFKKATIVAASNKYYTTSFYNFEHGIDSVVSREGDDNPLAFVHGQKEIKLKGYIGPKEYDILKKIDPRLTDVIEYGFFTFISKPLFIVLKKIHDFVGNWGWAIVIITILLRLLLYPLTYKGMVSMNKMKALSPKVKEIQAKYKGEPQKMNAKMMELYKKHGANPMGGCLPMLLQIPIFFAIYRVLLNAVELKHAPWISGWIDDLSVMDPYFILPILMGATMFWQQHLTPSNFTDPMQEKIMKFLPLIFTFFFITFPAGLTLYWFVNNLFSVAQQYYVNAIFDKEKASKS